MNSLLPPNEYQASRVWEVWRVGVAPVPWGGHKGGVPRLARRQGIPRGTFPAGRASSPGQYGHSSVVPPVTNIHILLRFKTLRKLVHQHSVAPPSLPSPCTAGAHSATARSVQPKLEIHQVCRGCVSHRSEATAYTVYTGRNRNNHSIKKATATFP